MSRRTRGAPEAIGAGGRPQAPGAWWSCVPQRVRVEFGHRQLPPVQQPPQLGRQPQPLVVYQRRVLGFHGSSRHGGQWQCALGSVPDRSVLRRAFPVRVHGGLGHLLVNRVLLLGRQAALHLGPKSQESEAHAAGLRASK